MTQSKNRGSKQRKKFFKFGVRDAQPPSIVDKSSSTYLSAITGLAGTARSTTLRSSFRTIGGRPITPGIAKCGSNA